MGWLTPTCKIVGNFSSLAASTKAIPGKSLADLSYAEFCIATPGIQPLFQNLLLRQAWLLHIIACA